MCEAAVMMMSKLKDLLFESFDKDQEYKKILYCARGLEPYFWLISCWRYEVLTETC